MAEPVAYLSITDICRRSGFRRETLWRKRQAGKFPPPFTRAGQHPKWMPAAIDAWLAGLSWSEMSPAWREAADRYYRRFLGQPGPTPTAPKRYDELQRLLAELEKEK